jgi:DNA-binding NarL/FixJ family response regulator
VSLKKSVGESKVGSSSTGIVRILVVDDYEPFRLFLHSKLQPRSDLQIVGEASDGLEAVEKAKDLQPDLIFLDIGLPSLNGIEAAHLMLRFLPNAKILFISQETNTDIVSAALANGAKGFVRKENAEREVLPAVEAVLRGEHFVSSSLQQRGAV